MRQAEAADALGRQHALVRVRQQVLPGPEQVGRVRERVRQRRVVRTDGSRGRVVGHRGGMHAGAAHVQPAAGRTVHVPPAGVHVVGLVGRGRRHSRIERPVVRVPRVHRPKRRALDLAQKPVLHVGILGTCRRCGGSREIQVTAIGRRRTGRAGRRDWPVDESRCLFKPFRNQTPQSLRSQFDRLRYLLR